MADYSKFKVTELKEMLSQRELPITGKKEDLVSRLTADDATKATPANGGSDSNPEPSKPVLAPAAAAAPPVEKKEVKKDTSEAATTAPATAPVQGDKKKFTFKRLVDEFEEPKTQASPPPLPTATETETQPEEVKALEPDEAYSAGLASTDADSELEKRKKRAARFGVPTSDSIKIIERAKRFGTDGDDASNVTDNKTIKALDSALGENRGKKRGPETRIQNDPPKKSKDAVNPSANSKNVLSDPTEKSKAEARAKRFGGA